jgi:putative AdoMet-dependent methyltransferase
MVSFFSWQYDRFKPVGRDNGSKAEVDVYDSSHSDFRDIVAASQRVLNVLGIKRGDTVIDFGSGAGTFAIEAAKRGQECMPLMFGKACFPKRSKAQQGGCGKLNFIMPDFLLTSIRRERRTL